MACRGFWTRTCAICAAESAETIALLSSTPAAALGSCRKKLKDADYERLLAVFRAHDIRYFFYNGGNDSADTTHKVGQLAKASGWEMRVIGIPKTVDNDLGFTDHCPGYGSVARFNALALQGSGLDTEAMSTVDTVKIFETMGRNAGWITAATALARASRPATRRTSSISPSASSIPSGSWPM